MLKVDGELTRRNRLRVETFTEFERHEAMLIKMQRSLEKFGSNQSNVLGTIRKVAYALDIQSSLNIQDEVDREWVSLFGKIDERTGGKQVSDAKEEES